MAVKLYNDTDIQNIADSIRAKNGSGYTYKVSEMSAAINGLEVLNGETVSITPSTSAQTITPSSGHNGITEVNVAAVTSSIDGNIQAGNIKKDISILGVTGTLNEGITPTGELAITSNGTYNVTDYASANVNVPEKQLGTKTITTNGTYNASDDNLDGYSEVEVETSGVDINDYYLTSGSYSEIRKYIKKIPLIDTSAVTNMYSMFSGCVELRAIPQLNTSAVTNMSSMFHNCGYLKTIPQLDTSSVTNMNNMFYFCPSLITIPQLDTSNVTDTSVMFYNCQSLTTIPQLDLSKVTNVRSMFVWCYALTTLGGFQNLGMAYNTTASANNGNYTLKLSDSSKLTHDSLMNVINNLYDIKTKGCNPQQLILGSKNLAKLTAEEIAIATEKGFNVS